MLIVLLFPFLPFLHYIIGVVLNCTFVCSDDPWFRGPWFVRPEEVSHLPTRMFLHKELFMSNIQDTNPMRSIIGKCAVLFVNDYCKCKERFLWWTLLTGSHPCAFCRNFSFSIYCFYAQLHPLLNILVHRH